MAEVDPRIMNIMRAQLHKDLRPELAVPRQARSTGDEITPVSVELEKAEPGGVRGILSRFALRVSGPELSGD